MYRDTITIFNRLPNKTGDIWFPTVLTGVDLNVDEAAISAKFGASNNCRAILHTKISTVDGKSYIGTKPFLPPKEWKNSISSAEIKPVTFSPGEDFDFFILGDWFETESCEEYADILRMGFVYSGLFYSNEVSSGIEMIDLQIIRDGFYASGFYDWCRKHFDYCFAVSSWAQYSVIPHLEILGR